MCVHSVYPLAQVRAYTRGVVVRAVNPETRAKLFDRLGVTELTSMRSFLDPPPQKGLTIKGSGDVGYHLHSRNHRKEVVHLRSELHDQVPMLYPKMYTNI
jgi:hypothetical protein